jgi:hypothetical protein
MSALAQRPSAGTRSGSRLIRTDANAALRALITTHDKPWSMLTNGDERQAGSDEGPSGSVGVGEDQLG